MPIASPPAPAKSSTLRIEKSPYSPLQPDRILHLALPHGQHLPSPLRECFIVLFVALPVPFQLRLPKVEARFGKARQRAIGVAMPEAAMNEDNLSPQPEDEVGTAGQIPRMQPIAVAQRED